VRIFGAVDEAVELVLGSLSLEAGVDSRSLPEDSSYEPEEDFDCGAE
jgi:hypothetical protein